MALSKQRKATLDANCLQFNKWCEQVLEAVYRKCPKAQVPFKSLMNLYGADVPHKVAADYYIIRHRRKTGG